MSDRPLILIIDDDADHVLIHSTLLSHHGYALITAHEPEAGLRLAKERRPGAILLDLHYNGEPAGLNALGQLQLDPATAAIPVIVSTAFADLYPRELAAQTVQVVPKDSPPEALLAAVGTVLPIRELPG